MNNDPLPIGTLILPNSYQIQLEKPVTGITLEHKEDLWGTIYQVHLSNGITRCIGSDMIFNLFQVVKNPHST